VRRYHDGTKHHFHRFARSTGYLDWASQPSPFRAFTGAPAFPFVQPAVTAARGPQPLAQNCGYTPRSVGYDRLFDPPPHAGPACAAAIGDLLRHALGLSAWKQYGEARWSLRVNPSSGNLHPTEAYIVCGACPGLADSPAVYHYAADRHALELRAAFDPLAWELSCDARRDVLLVALTSIQWREAWKYGERAFRYCQHDLGHAIAALVVAAAAVGWRAVLLPAWSQGVIAAVTGTDRDEDFVDAEREEPGCILAVGAGSVPAPLWNGGVDLAAAAKAGRWSGRASQLSEDHVQWTFIDEIARATEDPGRMLPSRERVDVPGGARGVGGPGGVDGAGGVGESGGTARTADARALILQRRSAVAFDGRSSIDAGPFFAMLSRVMPAQHAPWDALWWTPRVHLAIFVHRVVGVAPGLYLLPRGAGAIEKLRAAFGREFLWEEAHDHPPLVGLARGDCRRLAERLSCDQAIAADGFFSLGMIAEFDASLDEIGPSFYRHLFWESGFIGQVLYLEAEAAGARATGIGCFYDDPVHDTLGLHGHAFQSLYHFTVGTPVEDTRLTTQPGYEWDV
jgi:SagB-type dehydrogenase family enzyme